MLDAITGSPAIEQVAYRALVDAAREPNIAHSNFKGTWLADLEASWRQQLDDAGSRNAAPDAADFPSEIAVDLCRKVSVRATRIRKAVLEVPQRTVHTLDRQSLATVARCLAAADGTRPRDMPSPVLQRGWRFTFGTNLDSTTPVVPRYEVRVDHRWGRVRACTVIDRAQTDRPMAVLFEPHTPAFSHAGAVEQGSAQFIARLPTELWLEIASYLSPRDSAMMVEVGKHTRALFQPLVLEIARGVDQLITELHKGKIVMQFREIVRFSNVLKDGRVTPQQKVQEFERMRGLLDVVADLAVQTKGFAEKMTRLMFFWPLEAREFALQAMVRRQPDLKALFWPDAV